MRTGFYFLDDGPNAIKKRKDKSDEIFSIAKLPFASVDNIVKVEIEKRFDKDEELTAICEYFDSTGTKALKAGTGDSLHAKLAVIIANRLLYVVDNASKIETGIMRIMVGQYPDYDIEAVKKAVQEKSNLIRIVPI